MAKENDPATVMKDIFVTRRSFDAPRELLFAAFTDPEHLMRWWAPKGFKMVYCKLDLRPHGMLHYCVQSPEGKPVWGRFAYRKIEVGQRIVFINSFLENVFPGWAPETLHNVVFMEQHGKTTIFLTSETVCKTPKKFVVGFKQMKQGFNESFDQLEDYVSGINGNIIINKIA